MSIATQNDLVLLISRDRKQFFVRLTAGARLQTHRGYIAHDDLIGQPLGREIHSHLGAPFLVLEPSTHDLITSLKRTTQIMYPKDIGYVLLKMNIKPGSRVIEAGTGSGGLCLALARTVMPTGRVYSYEVRPDVLNLARKNLERLGLTAYVDFRERDIADGFDETDADALFLDVRQPWDYLAQARAAVKGGGFFGSFVPTTNQASELIATLPHHGFSAVEMEELLLRAYRAEPQRLRPMDRMIAHTGYLIFARRVDASDTSGWFLPRKKTHQRKREAHTSGES